MNEFDVLIYKYLSKARHQTWLSNGTR